jgi:hypothetical protein
VTTEACLGTGRLGRIQRAGICKLEERQTYLQTFRNTDMVAEVEGDRLGISGTVLLFVFSQDPVNGRIYVYRELYERELTDRQQAQAIVGFNR